MKDLNSKESVFEEAERIVGGARMEHYGPAERCNGNIAEQWSLYLRQRHNVHIELDYEDVSWMMADLKKVRQMVKKKRDNLVDAIGYIGLIQAEEDIPTLTDAIDKERTWKENIPITK